MSARSGPRVEIRRLSVDWTVDDELSPRDRERLDRLALGLSGDPLADALTITADREEVCVRRLDVPRLRFDWARTDDELVDQWARAIADATLAEVGGAAMLRYPSRFHATCDMVVSLLGDHHERAWAWELMELDPDPTAAPDAVVRRALVRTAEHEPGLVAQLVAEVARSDQLATLVRWIAAPVLASAAEAAWQGAGGGPVPPTITAGAPGPDAARSSTAARVAAAMPGRSAIWRAAGRLVPSGSPDGRPDEGDGDGSWATTGTGLDRPPTVVTALARLALLEAEPGLAAAAYAEDVVALLVDGARTDHATAGHSCTAEARSEPAPRSPSAQDRTTPAVRTSATSAPDDGHPSGSGATAQPAAEEECDADGAALPSPLSPASAWGGLLFLLSVLDRDGFAGRVAEDPATYGPSLRRALWLLAAELVATAAPDAPRAVDDPAVLAFCGLAPDADAPDGEGPRAWLRAEADGLVATLRELLPGDADHSRRRDRAVLLRVIGRRARLRVEPGWIDAEYDLDDVDVDVRAAGLDLDPGFLPWLGAVVRFRYV